jgi:hypothetical protein
MLQSLISSRQEPQTSAFTQMELIEWNVVMKFMVQNAEISALDESKLLSEIKIDCGADSMRS